MVATNLNYRIGVDIDELRRSMEQAGTLTRQMARDLAAAQKQQDASRQAITDLGTAMVAFGVAGAAGLAVSAKAAIEWESAFAGVRKTVSGSPEEIASLEKELRGLALTLPASQTEIAGVAEAAGQLGIKREDVAQFTKTMINMGEATNLTSEEAATGIAKMSNIMGVASGDADRLGSAIVALGNSGASTEQDILAMALRLAGAGTTAGLTAPAVLGIASALSSVGIEAEAGGSAISKVVIDIAQAVRNGGTSLDAFAAVAGVSAEQFRRAYEVDASTGIQSFVSGLGRIQAAGGDTFGTLDQLGYSEIRVRDALLRSANAGDLLTTAIKTGNQAWSENTALTNEANARYATTASQLAIARNAVYDAAISIGQVLLPAIVSATEVVRDLVRFFSDLPEPVRNTVLVLGITATTVGLVGGAALIAIPRVLALREQLTLLTYSAGAVGVAATAASRAMGLLGGPLGIALAAITVGLGVWAAASGKASGAQSELRDRVKDLSAEILKNDGAITANTRTLAANALEATKVGDSQDSVLKTFEALGISTKDATDALSGNSEAAGRVDAAFAKLRATWSDIPADAAAVGGVGAELESQFTAANAAQDAFNGLVGARNSDIDAARRQAAAAQDSGAVQETSADRVAKALGITTAEAAKLGASQDTASKSSADSAKGLDKVQAAALDTGKALDDLVKALDAYNGRALDSRAAQRDYIQQLADTKQRLGDIAAGTEGYSAGLDINTKAGRDNAAALDDQAKKAGDLADAIFKETGSEAAFRNSLTASRADLVATAVQFGMNQQEAQRYADKVLAIPANAITNVATPGSQQSQAELARVREAANAVPPSETVNVGVISDAAIAALRQVGFTVTTLPDGTVNVSANTSAANAALAELTRPRSANIEVTYTLPNGDIKVPGGTLTKADGGMVRYYAGGGVESHVAQVAPAGAWRVWAEPETGGEAYIPLSPAKRGRSADVLSDVAAEFGYTLVPKGRPVMAFAAGGMYASGTPRAPASTAEGRTVVAEGGISVSIDARGRTDRPSDVADELLFALRRTNRGGVYP